MLHCAALCCWSPPTRGLPISPPSSLRSSGDRVGEPRFAVPRLRPAGGFRIDPALVYALTRLESNFDAAAVSPVGARGLMQIMPITARYVTGDETLGGTALHDPSVNLDVGQRYVAFLARQDAIDGDLIRLLASYNAGPGSFLRWNSAVRDDGDPLLFIEAIPERPDPRLRAACADLHMALRGATAASRAEPRRACRRAIPALHAARLAGQTAGRRAAQRTDRGAPGGSSMARIDESRPFIPVNIAVLTVSDTRTLANDTSGDALAERIAKAGHRVAARAIEKDDAGAIERHLRAWIADREIDVVITTGGTGITGRDVTPEAFDRVLEKRIEGFGELFRMLSYQKIGTSTMQSRALGGVAGGTYLFALPGSTGAVKDAWDDILVCAARQPASGPATWWN